MLGRISFTSPWSLVISVFQKIKATLTDTYVFRLSRSPTIKIQNLLLMSSVIGIHSKKIFSTPGDDEKDKRIDRSPSASKVNIIIIFHNLFLSLYFLK